MASMTGFHHCVTAVQEAAGRELKEEELERIFERVQGRRRRYIGEGMSEQEAIVQAGKDIGTEMRMRAAQEKNSMLRNMRIRNTRLDELRNGSEAKDLRARVTGAEGTRADVANSTDAKVRGLTAQVLGPFVADLRRAGLLNVLKRGDKQIERQIIRELWSITEGTASAGHRIARQAAEIVHKHQEIVRLLQNGEGAFIGKLEHYVARQSHDMDRIRAAGYEAWRDAILPKLDARTFDNLPDLTPQAIDDFMRSTYKALASGIHEKPGGRDVLGTGFTGPGNLARRISEERKLHFKDADAWADYNEQFGKGTLWASIRSGLEHGARNTAVMRDWGTNPEAMFDAVRDRAALRAKDREDFKQVDALNGAFTRKVFDTVTGASQIPENATLASVNAWVSSWNTMTKLGGVVLTSFPDLASNAALLRHNGMGLFESYSNQLWSLLPKDANKRLVANELGVMIDGVLGNIAARFTAADGARGVPSRLVDLFHKMNGLEYWTESLKGGIGTALSHNLGRNAGKEFGALPARLQVSLRRYGIEAAEWDALRVGAAKAADGRMHIMPGDVADGALRSRYQTYIADQVSEGMTEPDAFSRTLATWGTQAGTPAGVAARLLMQFKQYPITFFNRTMRREGLLPFTDNFGNGRTGGVDVPGIMHLIVATTALGYIALEAKAFSRGRNPRMEDAQREDTYAGYARLVFDAMKQGGGMGFYGDFLFGQPSRSSGPVVDLMGPTVGTLDDLGTEIQNLTRGVIGGDERALRDARSGAVRLIRDNAPFVNMFYTRAIADGLLWYSFQEWANPGYLSRYTERVRREQGSTFRDWFLSPQNAPRW